MDQFFSGLEIPEIFERLERVLPDFAADNRAG